VYTVPTFIDLPRDNGLHTQAHSEVWYVASALRSGQDEFGVLLIFSAGAVAGGPGQMFVHAAVTECRTGKCADSRSIVDRDQVHVSADSLHVRTPQATLTGDLSDFELTAVVSDATVALRMSAHQILYNAGTGIWPWVTPDGRTYEFSVPNIRTSGSLGLGAKSYEVAGGSWYDRQWITTPERPRTFQWMGLCLDNDYALSAFELTGCERAGSWVTCLRPDGSHVVASLPPFGEAAAAAGTPDDQSPGQLAGWRVAVPALDADLRVSGYKLMDLGSKGRSGYTGVLSVVGQIDGTETSGYGFTDVTAPV